MDVRRRNRSSAASAAAHAGVEPGSGAGMSVTSSTKLAPVVGSARSDEVHAIATRNSPSRSLRSARRRPGSSSGSVLSKVLTAPMNIPSTRPTTGRVRSLRPPRVRRRYEAADLQRRHVRDVDAARERWEHEPAEEGHSLDDALYLGLAAIAEDSKGSAEEIGLDPLGAIANGPALEAVLEVEDDRSVREVGPEDRPAVRARSRYRHRGLGKEPGREESASQQCPPRECPPREAGRLLALRHRRTPARSEPIVPSGHRSQHRILSTVLRGELSGRTRSGGAGQAPHSGP